MNLDHQFAPWLTVAILFVGAFTVANPPATAGSLNITYELSGVILNPDLINPRFPRAAADGRPVPVELQPRRFRQRYRDLDLPLLALGPYGIGSLTLTIGNQSLTGTLPGNFHSDGVDFTIALSPGLVTPDQGSGINYAASTFDIWGSGQEYVGHVSAGDISLLASVPEPSSAVLLLAGLGGFGIVAKVKNRFA